MKVAAAMQMPAFGGHARRASSEEGGDEFAAGDSGLSHSSDVSGVSVESVERLRALVEDPGALMEAVKEGQQEIKRCGAVVLTTVMAGLGTTVFVLYQQVTGCTPAG